MIDLHENFGESAPDFSSEGLVQSVDKQLAAKRLKSSRKAQELFYNAMEAASDGQEFQLLQEALTLDPGNIDALLGVLRHRPMPLEKEIALLRKIVALGEKRLGRKAFKDFAGAFWGFIETRPYMRARERLAESLRYASRLEEAVAEWEAMLKLNPNDNQGVRYALLASHLALNRLDRAAELFGRYDECTLNTVFAWCRVLERYLSDDLAAAVKALQVARKQNPYTEAYLKGHKRLPKFLPDGYSIGSKEEAICFAENLRMAWAAHPTARKWLETQQPRIKEGRD
jgi:tetratricopeptide (TPR) repeat protein